ncbi:heat-shock protein Hsp20 [Roseovarius atlanticus]|uniref:Heat-shock protein Hsp20 n=1 Tax=Roseovarius atlanticus TaxID=1641875 RepID=A0A0T5NNQ2_9RHOB|nr:Hsp20/alpha crystallin family protein [Roseovarius atlanticus]KRS10589.1 heat-shock protein Hsp20 [Roseovarius atlanticus]
MQIKDIIPWAHRDHSFDADTHHENPIATLQRDLNKVLDNFRSRFGDLHWPWGHDEARSDIVGTKDAIEVSVELPGMEMKDIEVSVADGMLTVKGEKQVERQEEKQGYYLSERSYGAIYRTVPLPPGVDTERAEAEFKNGVLTVRLPHTPEALENVKRIEIKEK